MLKAFRKVRQRKNEPDKMTKFAKSLPVAQWLEQLLGVHRVMRTITAGFHLFYRAEYFI